MADIILQARDLCKSFSSEGVQNHVLNNMDLDIYKGVVENGRTHKKSKPVVIEKVVEKVVEKEVVKEVE